MWRAESLVGRASPTFFNLQQTISFFYTGLFYPNTMMFWVFFFLIIFYHIEEVPAHSMLAAIPMYTHALPETCGRFRHSPLRTGSAAFATQCLSTGPSFSLPGDRESIVQRSQSIRRHVRKPPARFLRSRNLLIKFSVAFPHHGGRSLLRDSRPRKCPRRSVTLRSAVALPV